MNRVHGTNPRCSRCGSDRDGERFLGCSRCQSEGIAVNLFPELSSLDGKDLAAYAGGPWGWKDTLPLDLDVQPVTMGEGNTPVVQLVDAPDGSRIWIKNEGSNPTHSHKDRGHSVGVTKALAAGHETVIAATSGNAGVASAAYSARAGLRCVVLTSPEIPPVMRAMISAFGGVLVACRTFSKRNQLIEMAVERLDWFPTTLYGDPTPGSSFYIVEGYKSIAYELARDFGDDLAAVAIPTSAGDILAGVHRGFSELVRSGHLKRHPMLIAAEPDTGAAFTTAFQQHGRDEQARTRITRYESPAFSLGSDTPNWQGLKSLWESGGWPEAVSTSEFMGEYEWLATRDGLLVEPSAAVAVSAARRVFKHVGSQGAVIALSTSTGAKYPEIAMRKPQQDVPVVEPNLDELLEAIRLIEERCSQTDPARRTPSPSSSPTSHHSRLT